MVAEIKNLNSEVEDLKAMSKMWVNPLAIYTKEIILKNGSTVFGKIVYQDDKTMKVETLVGYLIIERDNIVRVVDNIITEEQQEYIPEQVRDSYSPPPMPKLRATSIHFCRSHGSCRLKAIFCKLCIGG